ncbi:2'-5' RNA ligase family protein [Amycolatopsis cihanbeyliensis]|uniref:2'-5' RNA ligase superfamily protein n=1 Tax=Amycolatopsis cihanbeyliensis TaxID=1128664 RepID=A0A542CSN0_AMYCI|nr:2'-5' RNA ligase family protein [Amycolatopsis cihanbeyliensis]TQI93790.1 2'-5' RNA ligase superfamily protein [Amycolatopsis cihanbeyliensis]
MPQPGKSAVVIPVPAADPLLDAVRERHPGIVRDVPAHLSVLYPFLTADELDDHTVGTLESIFAERAPAEVGFPGCARQPGFVYLPPEPPTAVRELSTTVRRHWPGLLPYGGAFGDPPPHLTVAMGIDEPVAGEIERQVGPYLPVRTRLEEAWLVVYTDRWTVRARFPFGGGP